MNILFVSESAWMSGVVYDLHAMAEGLAMRGHRVYAIDPGQESDAHDDSPREYQQVSRIHPDACVYLTSPRLRARRRGSVSFDIPWHLYRLRRISREIERLLRRERIDVIVLYSVARCGVQAVRLARKHKIPIVFRNVDMLHKLWPTPLQRAAVKAQEQWVYPRVDSLLALTPKYAEYLARLGADSRSVTILPFPIDPCRFHPAVDASEVRRTHGLADDDQVAVFVGALYEFGGLVEFVREFPTVLNAVPRAKLLIVGDGPIRPVLEATIDELNIERSVIVAGYRPYSMMPQYIGAATMCFNAFPINDVTSDIFSAKIIQYLACGKATVSSALPGITTMLPGESCGVRYVDGPKAMAREMIALLNSHDTRDRLGTAGLEHVGRVHDEHTVILKLEDALTETVGNKPPKRASARLAGSFAVRALREAGRSVVASWRRAKRTNAGAPGHSQTLANRLYNSANNGYAFPRVGQRIDGLPDDAVIARVRLYIDKVGHPEGRGLCVVRRVSDDVSLGSLGAVDVATLPDASAPRPKWVLFDAASVTVPGGGDCRIAFEWDPAGGDDSNYPRVRYNDTDSIRGVLSRYNPQAGWTDQPSSDASIQVSITR